MEKRKSIQYIISYLEKLVNEIPEIKCIYEFDSFDNTHVIKILPKKIFDEENKYFKKEEEIITNFINKFPKEGIVFISEDDILDVEKPLKIFVGKNFFKKKGG